MEVKSNQEKPWYRFVYLGVVILLFVNWLFHPQFGVFVDPCLSHALYNNYMIVEGKSAWVSFFTIRDEIKAAYNNGSILGIKGCGFGFNADKSKSMEELFFFGPFVLIFSFILLNSYLEGFRNTMEKFSKAKKDADNE